MEVRWYVRSEGHTTGPYSKEEVQLSLDRGEILPEAKVSSTKDPLWKEASSCFSMPTLASLSLPPPAKQLLKKKSTPIRKPKAKIKSVPVAPKPIQKTSTAESAEVKPAKIKPAELKIPNPIQDPVPQQAPTLKKTTAQKHLPQEKESTDKTDLLAAPKALAEKDLSAMNNIPKAPLTTTLASKTLQQQEAVNIEPIKESKPSPTIDLNKIALIQNDLKKLSVALEQMPEEKLRSLSEAPATVSKKVSQVTPETFTYNPIAIEKNTSIEAEKQNLTKDTAILELRISFSKPVIVAIVIAAVLLVGLKYKQHILGFFSSLLHTGEQIKPNTTTALDEAERQLEELRKKGFETIGPDGVERPLSSMKEEKKAKVKVPSKKNTKKPKTKKTRDLKDSHPSDPSSPMIQPPKSSDPFSSLKAPTRPLRN